MFTKARLHKLPVESDSSFLYKELIVDHFPNPWHFHKEYELVLIEKSTGTRFIGDNVGRFDKGNLCLIGPNIPHLFRNDQRYYSDARYRKKAHSIFIHFVDEFAGRNFFSIPEMNKVKDVLKKAEYVLDVCGKTKEIVIDKLHAMRTETPPKRLLSLLEILVILSESKDLKQVLSFDFAAINHAGTEKVNLALEFIMKNFKEKIYVESIASQLNMSTAAFSRYFKSHTRKTFSDYVTEVRIGYACRLLIENDLSVSEIGFKSGFDNLSNFYRHFKKIQGIIPKEYRRRFLNK